MFGLIHLVLDPHLGRLEERDGTGSSELSHEGGTWQLKAELQNIQVNKNTETSESQDGSWRMNGDLGAEAGRMALKEEHYGEHRRSYIYFKECYVHTLNMPLSIKIKRQKITI